MPAFGVVVAIAFAVADVLHELRRGVADVQRHRLGRECVGRALGILKKNQVYKGRGCDWAAFGLFRGPWEIIMPSGRSSWAFPLAEATKEKA